MRHVIHKVYYDYEKEEKWLNEMSAKGLALIDYSWCRYVFEDVPKGEYVYRLELLKEWGTNPESKNYLRFLEESGVECVATYMRWAYLRRKASEGEFDIYSDVESKIKHFKRINTFWCALAFLEYAAGLLNIITGVTNGINNNISGVNLIMGIILVGAGILFTKIGSSPRKNIKKLKAERTILE